MDKIIVLGDADMVLGFRLVGVTEAVICTSENADSTLNSLLERSDAGIVILQDTLMAHLSFKTKRTLEVTSKPVVITIGTTTKSGAESLQQLIKRAIGITLEK